MRDRRGDPDPLQANRMLFREVGSPEPRLPGLEFRESREDFTLQILDMVMFDPGFNGIPILGA